MDALNTVENKNLKKKKINIVNKWLTVQIDALL